MAIFFVLIAFFLCWTWIELTLFVSSRFVNANLDKTLSEIRAALEAAGTRHEIHVYEGADHGFNCDRRASYNEEAATDAWGRMVALFGDKLLG